MGKGKKEPTKLIREFSSGGVVFKEDKGKVLWLVTRSSPSPKVPKVVWRLPKGRLDDKNDNEPGPLASGKKKATEKEVREAAIREVGEEGGVEVEIVKKIETTRYFFNFDGRRYLKFVTFYLMRWKKDLPGGFDFETSEVAWLPFEKALKTLSYSGEREILKKAKELL